MAYKFITGKTARLPGDYKPVADDRPRKYGNRKVKADGYTFDSKSEYARYEELKLLEKAGKIIHLCIHPKYTVREKILRPNKPPLRAIKYTADFEYREADTGKVVVEDVKGVRARDFSNRINLFQAAYPDIDLRIIKAH